MSVKTPKTKIGNRDIATLRKAELRIERKDDEDLWEDIRLGLNGSPKDELPVYAKLSEPEERDSDGNELYGDAGFSEVKRKRYYHDKTELWERPQTSFPQSIGDDDYPKLPIEKRNLSIWDKRYDGCHEPLFRDTSNDPLDEDDEDTQFYGEIGQDDNKSDVGTMHRVFAPTGRSFSEKAPINNQRAFVMVNVPEVQTLREERLRLLHEMNERKRREEEERIYTVEVPAYVIAQGQEAVKAYVKYIVELRLKK